MVAPTTASWEKHSRLGVTEGIPEPTKRSNVAACSLIEVAEKGRGVVECANDELAKNVELDNHEHHQNDNNMIRSNDSGKKITHGTIDQTLPPE